MMKFLLAIFMTLFSLQLVAAVPVNRRDVFVPPILTPTFGAVWKVGSQQNVTWDVSHPPSQITNSIGSIFLRKSNEDTPFIELATNFSILLGRMEVEVPSVPPAKDYFIVLFGDSGDWSPNITIIN